MQNFAEAIRTGCHVRQHESSFVTSAAARPDCEIVEASRRKNRNINTLNRCARRLIRSEPNEELFDWLGLAFDFDGNSLRRIGDPARQTELAGKPVHERTKPDSLHGSAHRYFCALMVHGGFNPCP